MTERPGPTTRNERIISLDVLRGFAVLGILVMNIQSFAMIGPAYFNPNAYGDLSGLNHMVWLLSHVFFDMKFLTIFSMLFGAGIILMTERAEATGRKPAGIHYRRMLVLLLFGLAHGWILWTGDILYTYAMCGLLVYFFRHKNPKTLIILGLSSIATASLLNLMSQFSMAYWPEESVLGMKAMWAPDAAQVQAEVSALGGSWTEQMAHRAPQTLTMQTFVFLFNLSWRAGGAMLLGMGLFKLGVFGARLPARTYRRMLLAGPLMGLPLILGGIWFQNTTGWVMEKGFFGGLQFNYWGSIPLALGWVGLLMLFCQRASGSWLYGSLAATGQMAFTNYLAQTLICTTLFYGHGFGLFGTVERTGQILVVAVVWAVQLLWSPWWLKRFRFGPMEWLWRSLTYRNVQSMKRIPDLETGKS